MSTFTIPPAPFTTKAVVTRHELEMPAKRKIDMMTRDLYKGDELKPYQGRPGANDNLKLPSRMGSQLVYRKDAK